MTSVLVVEDDPSFAAALLRSLEGAGYQVTLAASVEQALATLGGAPFNVLLTDLRLQDRDGIELLASLRQRPEPPRTILMSGYATAKDHQTATELGVVRVLCKPFTPGELLEAVRHAEECESGFHGSVHGMSLVDLLQMLHLGRRTVTVRVGGSTTAMLHLEQGEVVHATRGERVGEDAFVRALNTRMGSVQTLSFDASTPRTISAPFDALLLDALRADDEYRRDSVTQVCAASDAFDFGDLDEPGADRADADVPVDAARPTRARSLPPEAPAFDGFELEVRTAWSRAASLVGSSVSKATAVAFLTDAPIALALQGALDPSLVAAAARAVLRDTTRLVGTDDCNHFECVTSDTVLAVFHARGSRWGLCLVDAAPPASGVIWFRSAIATIGRIVCGQDK